MPRIRIDMNNYKDIEQITDPILYDKQMWRKKIATGIKEIRRLRIKQHDARNNKRKNTSAMLESNIQKIKEELRQTILSRDYEF